MKNHFRAFDRLKQYLCNYVHIGARGPYPSKAYASDAPGVCASHSFLPTRPHGRVHQQNKERIIPCFRSPTRSMAACPPVPQNAHTLSGVTRTMRWEGETGRALKYKYRKCNILKYIYI